MSAWECKDPPKLGYDSCGCLPPGFSRLRYFFGKHLGVTDFNDEQLYHVAKRRFHNQYLHGAGILCGLGVSLQDADAVILRVGKGAALDRCGHEIVVGYDQCIDVNAWFQAERNRRLEDNPASTWPTTYLDDNGKLPLCVVIRYAECPMHPEPAPRDSCTCAEGGCEFGRVNEGYELRLMTEGEALASSDSVSFPSPAQIEQALTDTSSGVDLLHRLAEPVTDGCPGKIEDSWLALGCFLAVRDDAEPDVITTIEDLGERRRPPVLLSTEVIQYLLGKIYVDLEMDIGAPTIIEVKWRKPFPATDEYQIVLCLSDEVEGATLDAVDGLGLRRLISTGWSQPGSGAISAEYHVDHEVPGPAIYFTFDNSAGFLEAGGKYQLYINPAEGPIVDSELRQLRPHGFQWRFGLDVDPDNGELVMTLPPFNT